jgi:hypothetical protein
MVQTAGQLIRRVLKESGAGKGSSHQAQAYHNDICHDLLALFPLALGIGEAAQLRALWP